MGIFDKLKDVNQMRQQAKQMELLLSIEVVSVSSSGGGIVIVMDGNQKVKSVQVDPSVAGDKSEVARHIRQALDDVMNKHKKMLQKKFGSMLQQ